MTDRTRFRCSPTLWRACRFVSRTTVGATLSSGLASAGVSTLCSRARPLSLTSRGAHLHTRATQTATTAAATELDAMSSLVTRPKGSHGARARDRRRARSMHARRNLMVHLTGGRRLVEAVPPREARSSPPHSLRSGCSLLRCREHESYCCVQLQIVQNHREIIKSQRNL